MAFQDDISFGNQLFEKILTAGGLQVQRNRPFVGVVEQEIEAAFGMDLVTSKGSIAAAGIAGQRLYLHHVRPIVGQQFAAEHGFGPAQVQDSVRWEETALLGWLKGHRFSGTIRITLCPQVASLYGVEIIGKRSRRRQGCLVRGAGTAITSQVSRKKTRVTPRSDGIL